MFHEQIVHRSSVLAAPLQVGVPMNNRAKKSLADPSHLKPMDADDQETIKVIIETPKGSRNKYAYDEEERIFVLKKVLPAGMAFPYDFGFVPSFHARRRWRPSGCADAYGRTGVLRLRCGVPFDRRDRRRAARRKQSTTQRLTGSCGKRQSRLGECQTHRRHGKTVR
jgi:hypothetical protein